MKESSGLKDMGLNAVALVIGTISAALAKSIVSLMTSSFLVQFIGLAVVFIFSYVFAMRRMLGIKGWNSSSKQEE